MIEYLFLVEGPFDKQRLSLLEDIFDENKLRIFAIEGDVLTSKDYSKNYENIISERLNKDATHSLEDFDFIAQLFDTDGCFVDKSLIIQNNEISKVKYSRNNIEIGDAVSKIKTNEYKRNNIESFLSSHEIELYYNSCNIDDAFDGAQNPSNKQKKKLAVAMYQKYRDDLKGFIDLIFASERSNSKTYLESWSYIKQDTNSLSSTSNLKFFILGHLNDLKSEYLEHITQKYGEDIM